MSSAAMRQAPTRAAIIPSEFGSPPPFRSRAARSTTTARAHSIAGEGEDHEIALRALVGVAHRGLVVGVVVAGGRRLV